MGATLYFFAVPDVHEDTPTWPAAERQPAKAPLSVLRTVLDGDFSTLDSGGVACLSQGTRQAVDAESCPRRVVIDYLSTSEASHRVCASASASARQDTQRLCLF